MSEKSDYCRFIKDSNIEISNNFVNKSNSGQIRARQDVPPTMVHSLNSYKSSTPQYGQSDDRGRSKTRNFIDYNKYQDQMYLKNYKGNSYWLTI